MVRARAGEGVDRLARVADDADVLAASEPQLEQPLLEQVDVLVLVDDEVVVLRLHLLGDEGRVLEHRDGEQQHVLEVDQPPLGGDLAVRGVDAPDHGSGS